MCLYLPFMTKTSEKKGTEKALTLSSTVRHIHHIPVSNYHCAVEEEEVDKKKKREKMAEKLYL